MIRRPPSSPLFPYTTLSRSVGLLGRPGRPPPRVSQPLGRLRRQGSHRLGREPRRGVPGRPCLRPPFLHHPRSEEHTSELQSPCNLVCRLLLEKKRNIPAWLIIQNRYLYGPNLIILLRFSTTFLQSQLTV